MRYDFEDYKVLFKKYFDKGKIGYDIFIGICLIGVRILIKAIFKIGVD